MKRLLDELLDGALAFFMVIGLLATIAGVHQQLTAQTPHGTASEEVPKGAMDGINATFSLNFQPAPWGSIHLFRNGMRVQRNNDYTLGGSNHMQVIFSSSCTPSCIPQPGDTLLADYTY